MSFQKIYGSQNNSAECSRRRRQQQHAPPPGDAGLALGRLGTWRERSGSRAAPRRASTSGVLSPISGTGRALPGWLPLALPACSSFLPARHQ